MPSNEYMYSYILGLIPQNLPTLKILLGLTEVISFVKGRKKSKIFKEILVK